MQITQVALVLTILVIGVVNASPEQLKAFKQLYCSEDASIVEKVTACIEKLPEEVKAAKKACKEEAAPGVEDPDQLKASICDESTGVGAKIHECLEAKKAEKENLSAEAKAQLTEAVQCMADLL